MAEKSDRVYFMKKCYQNKEKICHVSANNNVLNPCLNVSRLNKFKSNFGVLYHPNCLEVTLADLEQWTGLGNCLK